MVYSHNGILYSSQNKCSIYYNMDELNNIISSEK